MHSESQHCIQLKKQNYLKSISIELHSIFRCFYSVLQSLQ